MLTTVGSTAEAKYQKLFSFNHLIIYISFADTVDKASKALR